jgi:hypothetical protein
MYMVVCPMPLSNQMESRVLLKKIEIRKLKKNKTKLTKSRGVGGWGGWGGGLCIRWSVQCRSQIKWKVELTMLWILGLC